MNCIKYSPDGYSLVSSSEDNTCKVWEVLSGKLAHVIQGHTGKINTIQFSHDGKLLASCSEDKTCKIWNISCGKPKNVSDSRELNLSNNLLNQESFIKNEALETYNYRLKWNFSPGTRSSFANTIIIPINY